MTTSPLTSQPHSSWRQLFSSLFVSFSLVLVLALSSQAQAQVSLEQYKFDDPAQESLFRELINELRCPKCQNQTIADSDAPLAKDLRDRTYLMVKDGATKQQVVDYMVARYGDFAYYRPPVRTSTLVLWLGPLAVVLIGAAVVLWRVRSGSEEAQLSEAELAQLARLQTEKQDKSE